MDSQFKNLQQLLDFLKDENFCKEYYEQKTWGGNPACSHFGNGGKIYRTNRGFKCGKKLCFKKFSVIIGTIIAKRLSIIKQTLVGYMKNYFELNTPIYGWFTA